MTIIHRHRELPVHSKPSCPNTNLHQLCKQLIPCNSLDCTLTRLCNTWCHLHTPKMTYHCRECLKVLAWLQTSMAEVFLFQGIHVTGKRQLLFLHELLEKQPGRVSVYRFLRTRSEPSLSSQDTKIYPSRGKKFFFLSSVLHQRWQDSQTETATWSSMLATQGINYPNYPGILSENKDTQVQSS